MPCEEYKGAQRRLCFATKEWKDWSKIKTLGDSKVKKIDLKIKAKAETIKLIGGKK